MNWFALAELLRRIFGPVLAEWLKRLLDRAGPPLPPAPIQTADAVRTWFAGVRARTWRWEIRTRARLAVLEAVALRHAPAMSATLRFGAAAPVLTNSDAADLAASM